MQEINNKKLSSRHQFTEQGLFKLTNMESEESKASWILLLSQFYRDKSYQTQRKHKIFSSFFSAEKEECLNYLSWRDILQRIFQQKSNYFAPGIDW